MARLKWLVLVGWIAGIILLAPQVSRMGDVQENDAAAWLPESAESTTAAELNRQFPGSDVRPAVVVYERPAGVTEADRAAVEQARNDLWDVAVAPIPPITESADGQALLLAIPLQEEDLVDPLDQIQTVADRAPPGLETKVAGPAGSAAAFFTAFDGADSTLFLAAALVVTVLLLLIYRSPVLWLLPLVSAAVASLTAESIVVILAENTSLTVNGQTAGILPVLVFGAGTDYALLLLARYREELHTHEDRHRAMTVALRRSVPAILASSATVALGMLCLLFADLTSNKGLGPVAAVGIVCAFVAVTTLLPALLLIFGRWIFWPANVKAGTPLHVQNGLWGRVGRLADRRRRAVWVGTAVVLAGLAIAGTGLQTGLSFADQFTSKPDAVRGEEMIARHFPSGQTAPAEVIADASATDEVSAAALTADGVADLLPATASADGRLVRIPVVLEADGPEATGATVDALRAAVHAVPDADAIVGGMPASEHDVAVASEHDRLWVPPMVLGVVFLILVALLRSVVAPALLVASVVLSFGAAVGASWLLFSGPLGFAAVDQSWLLLGFVMLIALGVDYNIFLAHRCREEVQRHGHREGMLRGLAATGGVITSAGVVLAATFAALALIPLVTMAEMGVLIALGVLIDTLLVRSLLVPMLAVDVGERFWWPGGRRRGRRRGPSDPSPTEPDQVLALR